MDAALGFLLTGPAAIAGVFVGGDSACAGPAADGGVALLDQRVARQLVIAQPVFDLFGRPGGERVDCQDAVDDLERFERGAVAVLIAFTAGDAGVEIGQRLGQRLDLAKGAAGVRRSAPQVAARVGGGQGGGVGRDVTHIG
ncbi:hypothetical protein D3C86_1735940 [compost metagenome]